MSAVFRKGFYWPMSFGGRGHSHSFHERAPFRPTSFVWRTLPAGSPPVDKSTQQKPPKMWGLFVGWRPLAGVDIPIRFPNGPLSASLRSSGEPCLRVLLPLINQPNKQPPRYGGFLLAGVPSGSRTRVIAVRGQCPRPLDDGDF